MQKQTATLAFTARAVGGEKQRALMERVATLADGLIALGNAFVDLAISDGCRGDDFGEHFNAAGDTLYLAAEKLWPATRLARHMATDERCDALASLLATTFSVSPPPVTNAVATEVLTDRSVDKDGNPIRVGAAVIDATGRDEGGVVVAIGGRVLLYRYADGDFDMQSCSECRVIVQANANADAA